MLELHVPSPANKGLEICAGMAAGVVQTFVVAPVELLKIRQQLQARTSPAFVP